MLKYVIAFFVSMIPVVELRGAVPIAIASEISEKSTVPEPASREEKPQKYWERIVPEFPLALFSILSETALAHCPKWTEGWVPARASATVPCIFEPVSPSGTGNTFRSFISFSFVPNAFAAQVIQTKKSLPLNAI